ncbi:hypothetical protein ACF0H5_018778 [Mactra antiquata]
MISHNKIYCLILASVCLMFLVEQTSAGDCWDMWSRCSKWSSPATGYLWLSCDNCCKCKGKASGKCKKVTDKYCWVTGSSTSYRCICSKRRLRGRKPKVCKSMSNAAFSCK